jgi:hypothetical protein
VRVRVLKDHITGNRAIRAGEIVEIDPETEGVLLKRGIVMQDKSLDGGKENKKTSSSGRIPEEVKDGSQTDVSYAL